MLIKNLKIRPCKSIIKVHTKFHRARSITATPSRAKVKMLIKKILKTSKSKKFCKSVIATRYMKKIPQAKSITATRRRVKDKNVNKKKLQKTLQT